MAGKSDRQRLLLGCHVTIQVVAFVVVALALAAAVGFAILSWLESTA